MAIRSGMRPRKMKCDISLDDKVMGAIIVLNDIGQLDVIYKYQFMGYRADSYWKFGPRMRAHTGIRRQAIHYP